MTSISKLIAHSIIVNLLVAGSVYCQQTDSEIYEFRDGASAKGFWAFDTLKVGESKNFIRLDGPGVINKLWWSTFPLTKEKNNHLAQNIILNIYWDDSDKAAVSVPLADFFCQPLQLQAVENHFFNSTNDQVVFNSLIPMPFRTHARLELLNRSDIELVFFYALDVEYKTLSENSMYLHAHWSRYSDIPIDSGFAILPKIKGKGRYLGTHIALHQQNVLENWPWYARPTVIDIDLEGDSREHALFIFTLDDFIGSGWWDRESEHNSYSHDYTGRPLVKMDSVNNLSTVLYRYHVNEPLWFKENISFFIGRNWNFENQKIGNGTWNTTAFFYLDRPKNDLPDVVLKERE